MTVQGDNICEEVFPGAKVLTQDVCLSSPVVSQCRNTIKCPQSTGTMLSLAYEVIPEPGFLSSPSSDWLQLQINWKANMRTYISVLLISSIVKMTP